jgi:hypothetical protein
MVKRAAPRKCVVDDFKIANRICGEAAGRRIAMNHNFEFKQLLQAYRRGIIDEATFEQEISAMSNGASGNGSAVGFRAFGKTYTCERDAIIAFLDKFGSAEGAAEAALRRWDAISKTDCVRGGIRMIAEREGYHSRVFERRLRELGGTKRDDGSDVARQLDYYADPNLTDAQKLLRATASAGPDPMKFLQPIFDFADSIKEDLLTKDLATLYAKDELGSATWVYEACAMLNGKEAEVRTPAARIAA